MVKYRGILEYHFDGMTQRTIEVAVRSSRHSIRDIGNKAKGKGSGTKENQHKLIRRFIPKSKRLAEISTHTIKNIQQWMNNLPRKILGYRTAQEAFESEMKLLTNP